jgi:hypothetical protein
MQVFQEEFELGTDIKRSEALEIGTERESREF